MAKNPVFLQAFWGKVFLILCDDCVCIPDDGNGHYMTVFLMWKIGKCPLDFPRYVYDSFWKGRAHSLKTPVPLLRVIPKFTQSIADFL